MFLSFSLGDREKQEVLLPPPPFLFLLLVGRGLWISDAGEGVRKKDPRHREECPPSFLFPLVRTEHLVLSTRHHCHFSPPCSVEAVDLVFFSYGTESCGELLFPPVLFFISSLPVRRGLSFQFLSRGYRRERGPRALRRKSSPLSPPQRVLAALPYFAGYAPVKESC